MMDIRTANPIAFFWDNLGRFLLPPDQVTQNLAADVATILSRQYEHVFTDIQRALIKLQAARRGLTTLKEWAKDCARYQAGRTLLGHWQEHGLTPDEADALRCACGSTTKIKEAMVNIRLSGAMLALVEDKRALLVANTKMAVPSETVNHHPCGERPYSEWLADIITNPPSGPFLLIEFGKAPLRPEQLAMNLSSRVIRITSDAMPTIDRKLLLSALPLVQSVGWDVVQKLAILAEERQRDLGQAKDFDTKIDRLMKDINVDPYDIIDTLPPRNSGTWRMLRLLATKNEETDAEPEA